MDAERDADSIRSLVRAWLVQTAMAEDDGTQVEDDADEENNDGADAAPDDSITMEEVYTWAVVKLPSSVEQVDGTKKEIKESRCRFSSPRYINRSSSLSSRLVCTLSVWTAEEGERFCLFSCREFVPEFHHRHH